MKLMKWMTVTALATATVFVSGVESAEAASRGRGNKAEGGREESVSLDYQFTLFSTTPAGTFRVDRDGNSNNRSGFFSDAIEDFKLHLGSGPFKFDSVDLDSLTLDLQTKLIFEGEKLLLPNNQPVNLLGLDGSLTEKDAIASNDRIEYILRGKDLEENGILELTLIIDESELGQDENSNFITFYDIPSLNTPKKRKQAVNSLDYIIDNTLLGLVNRIRVSGKPSESTMNTIIAQGEVVPEIVSDDSIVSNPNPENGGVINVKVNLVTVPESNLSNSLLGLGILGLGLGLKQRKLK